MITHLVVGPSEHGVRRYAARLAEVSAAGTRRVDLPDAGMPVSLTGDRVLCHFTDRIFGTDARSAAHRFARCCAGAQRLTVVLHDIPQASDGAGRSVRTQGYLAVCELADEVVVNSAHEALLLRAMSRCRGEVWADALAARTHVVPLPVPDPPTMSEVVSGQGRHGPPVVATLGFIYPGKGLEEVIDAAADLAPTPRVVNLGRASPGHEDLVEQLTERARQRGVSWSSTGWLSDAELARWTRTVAVPVAAHRHLSASGSINTWLAAGRRPLVTPSRYTREMAARMPGSMHLADDLGAAIGSALDDPATTWLTSGQPVGRSEQRVAELLVALAAQDV